jgi:hypothetical protein
MTAAEFQAHHNLPQYLPPAVAQGEPQEEQPTAKDIFEDLDIIDEPPMELKRDIPMQQDEDFGG